MTPSDRAAPHPHHGRCHCGKLRWTLESTLAPSDLPARACQCGFCRAHGALSTSDPTGAPRFAADDATTLIRYRFATETAEFLICARCGVYVGAVMSHDGRWYGIVNLRTLEGYRESAYTVQPFDYSGESADTRRMRRASRWTPATPIGEPAQP